MDKFPYLGMIDSKDEPELDRYINFKLASMGKPYRGFSGKPAETRLSGADAETDADAKTETDRETLSAAGFIKIAGNLIQNYSERNRLLKDYLCAADRRLNSFLKRSLASFSTASCGSPKNV